MSAPAILYHFAFHPGSRTARLALGDARIDFGEELVKPWEEDCPVFDLNPSGMPPVLSVTEKGKTLTLCEAAREIWLDMSEAIEREQGEGGRYESISDWTSKLPGAVARIAALLQLATTGLDTTEVGFECMDNAVTLARLLIPHAQAAFGMLGTDATDVDAAAIVRWVRAGERVEFTKREAQKAQEGRFRSVDRLHKALERLEHQDVVRSFKRQNKGAPPSTCYAVNPKALSA